jgi:hypothetical protein
MSNKNVKEPPAVFKFILYFKEVRNEAAIGTYEENA